MNYFTASRPWAGAALRPRWAVTEASNSSTTIYIGQVMSSQLAQYDPWRTYNAAAVDYYNTSARFWRYAAEETVRRLALQSGERLLDIACGPGAAALAAARKVGPDGVVLGID